MNFESIAQRPAAPKHYCHAKGCKVRCKPKFLMCPRHWRMVPREIQKCVWGTYVPGQEERKDPTKSYLNAAQAAIDAVAQKEGK